MSKWGLPRYPHQVPIGLLIKKGRFIFRKITKLQLSSTWFFYRPFSFFHFPVSGQLPETSKRHIKVKFFGTARFIRRSLLVIEWCHCRSWHGLQFSCIYLSYESNLICPYFDFLQNYNSHSKILWNIWFHFLFSLFVRNMIVCFCSCWDRWYWCKSASMQFW